MGYNGVEKREKKEKSRASTTGDHSHAFFRFCIRMNIARPVDPAAARLGPLWLVSLPLSAFSDKWQVWRAAHRFKLSGREQARARERGVCGGSVI